MKKNIKNIKNKIRYKVISSVIILERNVNYRLVSKKRYKEVYNER